ncbi:MAG: metallopeptidase family protein [Gemmatimonadales bacterium]
MRLPDFQVLVQRLVGEVPEEFLQGVAEVAVSPARLPHPVRADIYTLGECIPLGLSQTDEAGEVQSRIVLYHGSFEALARLSPGFDWRQEAWETLTHELRHHLEWRARADALEAFDRAAEHNFARHDGEAFDPLFFLDGEQVVDGVYQVDDDFFLDRIVRRLPPRVDFEWHGSDYHLTLPPGLVLPCLLTVEGVADPPPGDLVLVLRRKTGLRGLLDSGPPSQATVPAEPGRAG